MGQGGDIVSGEVRTANSCNEARQPPTLAAPSPSVDPFPAELVLTPTRRNPIKLPEATIRAVLEAPLPARSSHGTGGQARASFGPVSVVVVTYNHLLFTRMCLLSLLAHTDDVDLEVIVVDNGSDDGTDEFLRELEGRHPLVIRAVRNGRNRGFAAACNQGLDMARGEILVLLNNDTIVPPGWIGRLARPLADPGVGLAGPVTNRAGNEAQVEARYETYGNYLRAARARAASHAERWFDIPMLTMFCLALKQSTYRRLGALDERFEVGMFEDDDYAMRARAAGYRLVCVEDVLVHHFGGASFGDLAALGQSGVLFQRNRARFESKWGVDWRPHRRRPDAEYSRLVAAVRAVICDRVPEGAAVIVVSRGDDELLNLGTRRAWHFPQDDLGAYAGHHPADGADALARLERLRDKGGEYFVIPRPSLWWLDQYDELRQYLETRCRIVARQDDACVVFELKSPS